MEESFWRQKWEQSDIAFHNNAVNPLLASHFGELSLAPGSRVFLPLCGKTLDIHWLLAKGYRVAGAELSEVAVGQLFAELGVQPTVTPLGAVERYSAEGIDIFAGNLFAVTRAMLGPVDAVYDRAALVALPEPMRVQYAAHLMTITNHAPQLLLCFEYDQSLQDGPPFSIDAEEVQRHYQTAYRPKVIASVEVPGGLKGKCPATEAVWLLKN